MGDLQTSCCVEDGLNFVLLSMHSQVPCQAPGSARCTASSLHLLTRRACLREGGPDGRAWLVHRAQQSVPKLCQVGQVVHDAQRSKAVQACRRASQ